MFLAIARAWWFPWALFGTLLAGIVRGLAGFGGAFVLLPILSGFLGPVAAVPVFNVVDAIATAPLLAPASRQCNWREVAPLFTGALLLLPLGVMILARLDANLLRAIMAVVLLVVAVLMAIGWQFVGRRTPISSVGIGALSGLMAGSIGLNGPPIALFWLDGNISSVVSRANIIAYTSLMTFATIMVSYWEGLLNRRVLAIALCLIPAYAAGVYLGGHSFHVVSNRGFRHMVLVLIGLVAVGTLIQLIASRLGIGPHG